MTPQELSDRLWHFAARVAKVVDALPDTRTGRHVAGQLIRCGTAAPPNYDEGRVSESRADFAHKINIALKEMVETEGWLKFIVIAGLLSARKCSRSAVSYAGFSIAPSRPPMVAANRWFRPLPSPMTDSSCSMLNPQ